MRIQGCLKFYEIIRIISIKNVKILISKMLLYKTVSQIFINNFTNFQLNKTPKLFKLNY